MNWEKAVIVLRNGGKITRPNWEAEHFWKMSKDGYERILCHDGTNATVHIKQTESYDWEIWKKEKSLSDKEWSNCCFTGPGDPGYAEKDVKEAVKKLLNCLEDSKNTCDAPIRGPTSRNNILNMVKQEAIKIFGEKLC